MISNKPDMPGQPKENPGKLKQWQTASKILNMERTLTNVLYTPKRRRKTHNGAVMPFLMQNVLSFHLFRNPQAELGV